ncbi:unnamed protein product [[Candida] boidinii]|nr:unnamed protein product [[Candida] boidinii]GMG28928.1 unnamed protein product [[Candida] boidinii]
MAKNSKKKNQQKKSQQKPAGEKEEVPVEVEAQEEVDSSAEEQSQNGESPTVESPVDSLKSTNGKTTVEKDDAENIVDKEQIESQLREKLQKERRKTYLKN